MIETFEPGSYSNAFLDADGNVTKISIHAFPTVEEADDFCDQLEKYHAALAAGPIAVAPLLGVEILEAADGFRVRHRMPYVAGPHLDKLPIEERRRAIAELIIAITAAPNFSGEPDRFVTPGDFKIRNFRGQPPVLTDTCPPYQWDEQGLLVPGIGKTHTPEERAIVTRNFGYKSSAIASLVRGVAPYPDENVLNSDHVEDLIRTAPTWYEDLLPAHLDDGIRHLTQERLIGALHTYRDTALRFEYRLAAIDSILHSDSDA